MTEKVLVFFLAVFIIAALFATAMLGVTEYYRPICLEAGYSQVQVTYKVDAFCVTRINQTDIVIPIEELH